jgi:elongation factor P--beta-lysine ligase
MPTPKECRHNAEICRKLARETNEIYAKMALIELANEFRGLAEALERRARKAADRSQRRASPARHRR